MKKYLLKNDDVIAIVIDDVTAFVNGYNIVLTTIMRKSLIYGGRSRRALLNNLGFELAI